MEYTKIRKSIMEIRELVTQESLDNLGKFRTYSKSNHQTEEQRKDKVELHKLIVSLRRQGLTYKEVGALVGLTPERIRQIQAKVIDQIRNK